MTDAIRISTTVLKPMMKSNADVKVIGRVKRGGGREGVNLSNYKKVRIIKIYFQAKTT